MQSTSAALLIAISLVVFGINYYYFTTRHKERMEIMERGLPADYFKKQSLFQPILLLLGIICISLAFGIIAGLGLSHIFPMQETYIFCISITLSIGIGLLTTAQVIKKSSQK